MARVKEEETSPLAMRDEQRVLAAVLVGGPEALAAVKPLSSGDFFLGSHGVIWEAILDVVHSTHPVEPDAVRAVIFRTATAATAPIISSYMDTMIEGAFCAPQIAAEVAERLRQRSTIRKIKGLLTEMQESAESDEDPRIITLAREMGKAAAGHETLLATARVREMDDLLVSTMDHLEDLWNGNLPRPLVTGIDALDGTGAFVKGDLALVAARPSTGKTAFGIQMARENGKKGSRVLFASLEMIGEQLIARQLAQESGVSISLLSHMNNRGGINAEDRLKVYGVLKPMGAIKAAIVDGGDLSIDTICALARARASSPGLDLLLIDYIQLVPTPLADTGRVSRNEALGTISRRLKLLAIDLNIVVVGMAQLNREADGERGNLKHLRESGNLEQDADTVIFLSPDLGSLSFHEWAALSARPTHIDVMKNRNGICKSVRAIFDAPRQRFAQMEERQ